MNVIPIAVPSLRERSADIPVLVESFVKKYGNQAGLSSVSVAPDALALLLDYEWPGNIRELENAVERAIGMCNGNVLAIDHFEWLAPKRQYTMMAANGRTLEEAKAEFEKAMIVDALRSTVGNIKKAAGLLKVDRSLLYQKMRRLGIQYR